MDHTLPLLIHLYKVRLGMPLRADACRTDTKWTAETPAGSRMNGHARHNGARCQWARQIRLDGLTPAAVLARAA